MRIAWQAFAAGYLLMAASQTVAQGSDPLTLPRASGEPQAIDFNRDPLLRFAARTDAGASFAQAVGEAVARDPAVGEALAVQAEAAGVRQEVRAGLRPRVDVDVLGQRVITREFENDPDNIIERSRPSARTDAVLTAEQLLYDFGATRQRVRAARERIEAARAEVEATAAASALEAITAWYELYLAQRQVELLGSLVERNRTILSDTQQRARQGVGPAGDTARVEASLAGAQAEAERTARQLAGARLRYEEAFGAPPPASVARPVPPRDYPGGLIAAIAASLDAAEVAAAARRAEAARFELRAARADRLPRFSAGLDAAKYSLLSNAVDHDVRGRVSMRHSLFAGGASEARVEQSQARLRQAEFSAQLVEQQVERDTGIAYRNVTSLADEVRILRRAYIASRRTRDLYAEQFRVARGSLLELLRAESDYNAAALAYLRSVAELDVARFALLERTGDLLDELGVEVVAVNSALGARP